MPRSRNTDVSGRQFSSQTVQAVWDKGGSIFGHDAKEWRRDGCGKTIQRSKHGDTSSQYGWEVDHIRPVAREGSDELSNLQPLQWGLNTDKGDTYPWRCP
jgi:hypothetical protein